MDKLPNRIAVSGKALELCLALCQREMFLPREVDGFVAAFDESGDNVPKSSRDLALTRRMLERATRRPWQARAEWLAHHCEPRIHHYLHCGFYAASLAVQPQFDYEVSSRWTPSLWNAMSGAGWTQARHAGDWSPFARLISTTLEYLDWGRLGGAPDLARWLSLFFVAGGEVLDRASPP
ncbi:MAG: hypothetical protein ABII12_03260 [Planctomycetota bacterium]